MKQNTKKRVIISFALAFGISVMTIFIQNSKKESFETIELEAKAYPKPTYLMRK